MGVSRSDYKPFDIYHPQDPFEAPTGFVSEVKDFHASVSYKILKETGNCSVAFIERDVMGDVTTEPDGTIVMTSPLMFWNMNEKFAFNGIVRFFLSQNNIGGVFLIFNPVIWIFLFKLL